MVQAGLAQPATSPEAPAAAGAAHVALKIPSGGGPYARAKHYQVNSSPDRVASCCYVHSGLRTRRVQSISPGEHLINWLLWN